APDYRPAAGSPALSNVSFADGIFNGLLTKVIPIPNYFYSQSTTPGSRTFSFNNSTLEKGFGTTYMWDFGVTSTVSDTSSAKNPSFTFPADGNYTVKLVAIGAYGTDSITKTVTVFATATNPFFIPTSYRGAF